MGPFTYVEKMEYLGLIWGAGVMILIGLILWFEVPFLYRSPYWANRTGDNRCRAFV